MNWSNIVELLRRKSLPSTEIKKQINYFFESKDDWAAVFENAAIAVCAVAESIPNLKSTIFKIK